MSAMPKHEFLMILDSTKMLTPNVKHFVFRTANSEPLDFIPGQFITILIPSGDKKVKRSYSIASMGEHNHLIEFAASYVEGGIASNFLFNLKSGEAVEATGPFGKLILRSENPKRYILVATSTGITPYRSMLTKLEHVLKEGSQVVVLMGVQTRQDSLYHQDFIPLAKKYPSFQFIVHYSQEKLSDAAFYEKEGRVHNSLKSLQLNATEDLVYLCGNPDMIDEAYNWLKSIGFTNKEIIREKYISSPSPT